MQKEKKIEKAEKALDANKPGLITTDAQIKHPTRKLQNAQTMREQVVKDKERQKEKLDGPKKDLAVVQKDAIAAQDALWSSSINQYYGTFIRSAAEGFEKQSVLGRGESAGVP